MNSRGPASVKRSLALVGVVLLLGACGTGRDAPEAPEATAESQESTTAVVAADSVAAQSQSVLDDAVENDEPGCSAAVGIEGKVVWTGARGLADLDSGAKITDSTIFDIASVSKQFTASAILLLADGGKLSLDDRLSDHVPGMPAWAETVTVSQVMHNSSGIPDYNDLLLDAGYEYSDSTTQEQALQLLAKVPELNFEPGTQFEYSNSNYLLLAEIVKQVSGQPLPAFLSTEIFKPLDLAMVLDPIPVSGKALAYAYDETTREYSVPAAAWLQIGDGAIQTTPSQLVRWADNYRTGKVGGQRLLEAQLAGAVPTEPGGGDRYGAGIYLLADGELIHDGSWAGFLTAFHVSADRRVSTAVSCNIETQDPAAIANELDDLWM